MTQQPDHRNDRGNIHRPTGAWRFKRQRAAEKEGAAIDSLSKKIDLLALLNEGGEKLEDALMGS